MCALIFSPWICGFGPFTLKSCTIILWVCVSVCVCLCLSFFCFSFQLTISSTLHNLLSACVFFFYGIWFLSICIHKYMLILEVGLHMCAFKSWGSEWLQQSQVLPREPVRAVAVLFVFRRCSNNGSPWAGSPSNWEREKERESRAAFTLAQLHTHRLTHLPYQQSHTQSHMKYEYYKLVIEPLFMPYYLYQHAHSLYHIHHSPPIKRQPHVIQQQDEDARLSARVNQAVDMSFCWCLWGLENTLLHRDTVLYVLISHGWLQDRGLRCIVSKL